MAEEKKEPWLNYLALTTIIFAVCATLSTMRGGGYSTKAIISQAQASDQWSYYQSKSIKGYLYDLQKDKLGLELKAGTRGAAGDYRKKIDFYESEIERYKGEREEIKKKAEDLEKTRDDARLHSGDFGKAAMYLQIAILLSSIAALMKKRYFWVIGVVAGVCGVLFFALGNDYLVFLKPFLTKWL